MLASSGARRFLSHKASPGTSSWASKTGHARKLARNMGAPATEVLGDGDDWALLITRKDFKGDRSRVGVTAAQLNRYMNSKMLDVNGELGRFVTAVENDGHLVIKLEQHVSISTADNEQIRIKAA